MPIIIILAVIAIYVIFSIFYIHYITGKNLLYKIEDHKNTVIKKNLIYNERNGKILMFDLYLPPDENKSGAYPCVIFIHGDGPKFLIRNAKNWQIFKDYGRLAASKGFAGITFNHGNSDMGKNGDLAEKDFKDMVNFLRNHSEEYRLDRDNIFIWVFSAGGAAGVSWILRENQDYIKGVIIYYGLLKTKYPEYSPVDILKIFSPLTNTGLPPFLTVKSERDSMKIIKDSNEEFYRLAGEKGLNITLIRHKTGRHAFDALDDNDETRSVIKSSLDFLTLLQKHSRDN